MKSSEFIEKLKMAADKKSAYMLGTWGWPCTEANITRAVNTYGSNAKYRNAAEAISENGFMFDCCGLIKGIMWGFTGDYNKQYGGAGYNVNGVPDVNEDGLWDLCEEKSENFADIIPGEYLYMKGHCGIYIGSGLAVEATPAFGGGTMITAVGNIGAKSGYNTRTWTKHGKLPFIEYEKADRISYGANTTVVLKELSMGSKGELVRSLQQLLIAKGFPCGKHGDDGDFGGDTLGAVKAFQRSDEKSGAADGIVGKLTWTALLF